MPVFRKGIARDSVTVLIASSPPLLLSSSATDGSHKHKKMKLHTSLTASDSSTIAEEVVVLLRRLHPLPAWNPLINKYISSSLQSIPRIILSTSVEDLAHLLRRKRKEGLREEQVCAYSSVHTVLLSS